MRITSVLAALLIPAAFVIAGLGSAHEAAAEGARLPPVGSTCETVLCSPGSICVDTRTGPICVLDPNGPSDS